jgi:hypothetical protein
VASALWRDRLKRKPENGFSSISWRIPAAGVSASLASASAVESGNGNGENVAEKAAGQYEMTVFLLFSQLYGRKRRESSAFIS